MRLEIDAIYFDGFTPVRRPVRIRLAGDGIRITDGGTLAITWPFAEIARTVDAGDSKETGLERAGSHEALLLDDGAFLRDLEHYLPAHGRKLAYRSRAGMRRELLPLALLGSLALAGAMYAWGIPALATLATPLVPLSWERGLGEAFEKSFTAEKHVCAEEKGAAAMQKIVTRLSDAGDAEGLAFHVTVLDESMVNAFALPGGRLLFLRGLLDKLETPEQVAGILAHEVQHVLQRHALQAVIEEQGLGLLATALTGTSGWGVDFARTLGRLRYSRQHEDSADRAGMKLVRAAKIDPKGMIAAFGMLEKHGAEMPKALSLLSTHPETGGRIRTLEGLAAGFEGRARPLLKRGEWQALKTICGTSGGKAE